MAKFMLLFNILILKPMQAIDDAYIIEPPSSSYQLSLNTLLSIPDYKFGIVYNFWISSEDSNALMVNKYSHNDNDGINLLNTYTIVISDLYEQIEPISISADYVISNKNLTILLAISYTATTNLNDDNTHQLIQLFKFDENFSDHNNVTIVAAYNNYVSQNTVVNILYNYDNETFKIIWNGKHTNTKTKYHIFDPCWQGNTCINNQSNIYSVTYQLYTMNMIDTQWMLLSNADRTQSLTLYPSSSTLCALYSITNSFLYECVYDYNKILNHSVISNISFSINKMFSQIDVNWVEGSAGEQAIFVVYEYNNTVYGTIKQINSLQVKKTFVLPLVPYNNYKVFNPVISTAYLSHSVYGQYLLSAWIVTDIGLFANIFNFDGERLFCGDVLIYETDQNISSVNIGSYIDYGIISFIIPNGFSNQIIAKTINYYDMITNTCHQNITLNTTTFDDEQVNEISTTIQCIYRISLSITAISQNETVNKYKTDIGKSQLKNVIHNLFNINDYFCIIIIEIEFFSTDPPYEYAIHLHFCISDIGIYHKIIKTLRNETAFINDIESNTDIGIIEELTIMEDPNIKTSHKNTFFTDEMMRYIIFAIVGLLILVSVCCIGLYWTIKRKRKRKKDTEKQNSLDPTHLNIKHEIIPSDSYKIRKEMEIAQMQIPCNKLSPKWVPGKHKSKTPEALRINTLEFAASKPLPSSRSNTMNDKDDKGFSTDDENNESMYPLDDNIEKEIDSDEENDGQVIQQVSTVFYDPTEDAQLYGGKNENNVKVIAMDTMYHEALPEGDVKPKEIPRIKTFVPQYDEHERLVIDL